MTVIDFVGGKTLKLMVFEVGALVVVGHGSAGEKMNEETDTENRDGEELGNDWSKVRTSRCWWSLLWASEVWVMMVVVVWMEIV